MPLLRCLQPSDAKYIVQEVHEGIYDHRIEGRLLAYKILKQGFYWPIIMDDDMDFI